MFGRKSQGDSGIQDLLQLSDENRGLRRHNMKLRGDLEQAYSKIHDLTDAMRGRALECASRSPGLPDEIMARAEEYLGWLRADGSPELVSEDGIVGDNPIPGFGPGEIVRVPKP